MPSNWTELVLMGLGFALLLLYTHLRTGIKRESAVVDTETAEAAFKQEAIEMMRANRKRLEGLITRVIQLETAATKSQIDTDRREQENQSSRSQMTLLTSQLEQANTTIHDLRDQIEVLKGQVAELNETLALSRQAYNHLLEATKGLTILISPETPAT